MVIDDDAGVRDLLQRSLSRDGFRVEVASNGLGGLALAKELKPDVITLDVIMPEMDGWAVLSRLKADPALADIPVIIITIVDDKNMGFALGAADYLLKPVDRDRLSAVLKRFRRDRANGKVLIVEDDADTRAMLTRSLTKEGYSVRHAENGRVALERMAEESPDLVLLDLIMPEMDGFAFVEAMRKRPQWQAIPVVVVTAKDLTPEDHQRLNGYVERILTKGSHTREELLAQVRQLVMACLHERSRATT